MRYSDNGFQLVTVVMVDVLPDELGVPMTVDDYTKQLRELQCIYFPEAELLPGMLRLITCAELCCVKQVLLYQQLLVCVCLCVGMCKQN